MPGHWGGSSGGGGPAGGASSGGNYGGNQGGGGGPPSQGGGGQAAQRQRAAEQAAAQRAAQQAAAQQASAQRAMQAQIAAAEKQQAITQQAPTKPNYSEEFASLYKQGKYDNLSLAMQDADRYAKGEKTNYEKIIGKNPITDIYDRDYTAGEFYDQTPATPSYQNIFQTGAIQQTPGGAYQPPAPLGTSEGLGSIAGPIQGLINQPKIAGPIQGLINQPKAAPTINPFEQTGNLPGGAYKPPAQIKNPFEQSGARTAIPRPPVRSRIQDDRAEDIRKRALGNIALQTDKSLTDVYDPSGQRQGIMSSFADTGKSMIGNQLKKGATSFALNKLGLGFLNPFLGLASLFGKDPIGALMAKLPKGTGTKTAWQPDERSFRGEGQGQAPANVIQAGVEKFQPTDQQTAQMDEIRRKRMILQGYADKGSLNERGMNTLEQMNQLISQYQADPRSIYG